MPGEVVAADDSAAVIATGGDDDRDFKGPHERSQLFQHLAIQKPPLAVTVTPQSNLGIFLGCC